VGPSGGAGESQPLAPPETVISEPAKVLPLPPVTRLVGVGTASLRLGSRAVKGRLVPWRLGLRLRLRGHDDLGRRRLWGRQQIPERLGPNGASEHRQAPLGGLDIRSAALALTFGQISHRTGGHLR